MRIEFKIFFIIFILTYMLLPIFLENERYSYLLNVLFTINIAIILAHSWNILGGFTGQISFGHAGLIGTGSYTMVLLFKYFNTNQWLGIFFGGIGATITALLIGIITFRFRGPYFALSTLAMAEILKLLTEGFKNFTGGPAGIVLYPISNFLTFTVNEKLFFYVSLFLVFLTTVFIYLIQKTSFFKKIIAIKNNENTAIASGINTTFYKSVSFCISGFFAGIGGSLFILHTGFIDPSSAFDATFNIEPIFLTIVGGISHVFGPVVGSLLLIPIAEFFRSKLPSSHLFVYGIILIIFARFFPKGILGLLKDRRPYVKS